MIRRLGYILLAIQAVVFARHGFAMDGFSPMAVVFIEGFDHLTSAQMTAKGWSLSFGSTAAGRFDGQCARLSSTGVHTHVLPSNYATIFAGFAYNVAALSSGTDFFQFMAGATLTCRVSVNASSIIQVRNSGGTVIATGTTALVNGAWNYIEVKLFVNGASGTVEVHLNGATEIASTAGNFGSSNIDTIGVNGSSAVHSWDDMYCCDTSGSSPRNTFLGDVRVETIFPTGAGNHTQWTPNGAASNWDCVDENPPDGDTSYVSDATVGHLDSYVFGDIDAGATVYGVQVNLYSRKDDAATRQIANLIRQASTDYAGSTVTLSSTYAFYSQIFNQDPTPADWTAANVNADEFGIKEIA
jgi:hypothetical protein